MVDVVVIDLCVIGIINRGANRYGLINKASPNIIIILTFLNFLYSSSDIIISNSKYNKLSLLD